ncbi:MAG TPA: hypothetical protein DCZ03_11365 [Gammaproteobacteria bacterium]|nr:hypothetical protein [Gammaproteobacteria bacterium]
MRLIQLALSILVVVVHLTYSAGWTREYYDDYEEFEDVGMAASILSRFYAGVGLGTIEFDVGNISKVARSNDILNQNTLISDSESSSGIGAKLFGGIKVTDNIALEAGWASLGEWKFDIVVRGDDPSNPDTFQQSFNIGGKVEIDTLIIGAVINYDIPSTSFGILARAGIIVWDSSVSAAVNPDPTPSSTADTAFSDSGSGTDTHFSLGGYYNLSKHLQLMGGWDRFDLKSGEESGLSVDLLYVALRLRG